jgi:hypothetical protein
MPSEILPIAQGIAQVVVVAIFLFAAFRAVSIGRALVNRVYRNRAYVTGVFAILVVANQLVPDSWTILGVPFYTLTYFLFLAFVFVLVDSTILVSLAIDFFHRNTLRWRQVRLVAYPLIITIEIAVWVNNYLPSNFLSTGLGEIETVVLLAFAAFVFVSSALTAIVSARRSADIPLRRFMKYTAILLLLLLLNTFVYVLVTVAIAPFLFIVFAYVTYRMAMSLSLVGKVQKTVEAASQPPSFDLPSPSLHYCGCQPTRKVNKSIPKGRAFY